MCRRWQCCRTGGWSAAGNTGGSGSGTRPPPGPRRSSSPTTTTPTTTPTYIKRCGPWRCYRTGGWSAAGTMGGFGSGTRPPPGLRRSSSAATTAGYGRWRCCRTGRSSAAETTGRCGSGTRLQGVRPPRSPARSRHSPPQLPRTVPCLSLPTKARGFPRGLSQGPSRHKPTGPIRPGHWHQSAETSQSVDSPRSGLSIGSDGLSLDAMMRITGCPVRWAARRGATGRRYRAMSGDVKRLSAADRPLAATSSHWLELHACRPIGRAVFSSRISVAVQSRCQRSRSAGTRPEATAARNDW